MDEPTWRRLLPVFLFEAGQRLDDMDRAILTLAREPGNTAAREALALAAHTIKGNSAALGLTQMTLEAQRLELWALLPSVDPSPAILAGLNEGRTALRSLLGELTSRVPVVA